MSGALSYVLHAAAVELLVGEARPLEISQYNTATESESEGSSGEAGSSWTGAGYTARSDDATVARVVGEVRPPEFAKDSATTESSVAVSSGEARLSWPRVKSTPRAVDAAVATPAGEGRPPGIAGLVAPPVQPLQQSHTLMKLDLQVCEAQHHDRIRTQLEESFGEDSFSDQEKQLLHSLRNMGRERAMRSFEKLRERRDLPAWLAEGFAELFQRFLFE